MLYCQENLPITNVQIFDDKICQALLCTCAISKSVFCIVYRPPDCTEQSFKLFLSFIDNYLDPESYGHHTQFYLADQTQSKSAVNFFSIISVDN